MQANEILQVGSVDGLLGYSNEFSLNYLCTFKWMKLLAGTTGENQRNFLVHEAINKKIIKK